MGQMGFYDVANRYAGLDPGAQHRDRPHQGAYRVEKPGLQHAPCGPPGWARRRPRADMSGTEIGEVCLERSRTGKTTEKSRQAAPIGAFSGQRG